MVIFIKKYIKNGVFLKKIYIKNCTFRNFLKSKFDPNIHQKRTKLHHFKKFSRGGMPPNPPSKGRNHNRRSTCKGSCSVLHANFKISKKKFLGPPLPNPGYAPVHLDGLRPRVYYTLTNFRWGGARPSWPTPQGRQTRQNSGGVGELNQDSGPFLKGSTY